jgi:hypothetical protein
VAEHPGVPTWVWIGGGLVVAVGAYFIFFSGSGQTASGQTTSGTTTTNAPSQSSSTGALDPTAAASSGATSSGTVPIVPTLDANGAVQTSPWATGWNTQGATPGSPTSLASNGSAQNIVMDSNQGILSGMSSDGAPVWWVPYTYANSPATQPTTATGA